MYSTRTLHHIHSLKSAGHLHNVHLIFDRDRTEVRQKAQCVDQLAEAVLHVRERLVRVSEVPRKGGRLFAREWAPGGEHGGA